jgi:hypothetical protein
MERTVAPLLDPSIAPQDDDYRYACGHAAARDYVETLWAMYEEHADKGFAQKLASKFHNHFWEMYLACALKSAGMDLLPKKRTEGPDIGIRGIGSSRIWVEAIAVGPGEGVDRVPSPDPEDEKCFLVPEHKIVQRYTAALESKYERYCSYRDKGIIAESEPYVVAVNGRKAHWFSADDEIPYLVQAVLPIGLPVHWVNLDDPKNSGSGYDHRSVIKRASGSSVPTDTFLQPGHEGLSGMLGSGVGIGTYPPEMGADFVFVHNSLARNKLPAGWLNRGREYRVEGDHLECRWWPS